jgi:hypothetical protein
MAECVTTGPSDGTRARAVPDNYGSGFGGLIRSTDYVDRDGPPMATGDEKRLVEFKNSGLSVWVTITQAERRRYINMCPKGWNKVILDREAGLTVEALAQKYRMETATMRDALHLAYGWVEQRLYALAEHKAGSRHVPSALELAARRKAEGN